MTAAYAEDVQVHIDYSVTSGELASRCNEAIRSGRSDQAVEMMAELLDKHPDELVEVEPGVYQPVAAVTRRMASTWPEPAMEQLQANRQILAHEQWPAIRNSTSVAELDAFAQRYFFCPEGVKAAERAGRLSLEAGQFDLARLRLESLRYHPSGRGQWKQVLEKMQAVRQTLAADPLPGEIRQDSPLAILWQTNLTNNPSYGVGRREPPGHWLAPPIVLDGPGFVVVQWDRHCLACESASGTVMWDYRPLTDKQAIRAGLRDAPAPRRPAAWQQRVYVVTEVPATQGEEGPMRAPQALSCLDAASGKPYWVRTAADMMSRKDPAVLDGTPVSRDGRVYVAGRVIRTGGYHDVQLLTVEARTGALLKRTALFGIARAEFTPNERIRPMHMGLHGGILYVTSTAGAAAAIDTQTLQPIWMRSFRPDGLNAERTKEVGEPLSPSFWADAPPVSGDQLVVPVGTDLRIVDRWTGGSARSVQLPAPLQALAAADSHGGPVAAIANGSACIIDPAEGRILHKLNAKAWGPAGLTPLAGGRFLLSIANHLRVVLPDGTNQALSIDDVRSAIPVVAGQHVFLGSNGYLTCLGYGDKPLVDRQ